MTKNVELLYVMDPHCGWRFGFGKVILELFNHYKNNPSVNFNVIPGGLFYPQINIGEGFADNKRSIAQRIEELTGVKFSEDYFSKILGNGSFLDSEPPARAIACIKKLDKKNLVPFTEKVLEKEFIYGKNNSLYVTIFETVRAFEIDQQEFEALYHSDEIKEVVLAQFQKARTMVDGYPVLFVKQNDSITKLAGGYAPFDRLAKKIDALIS